jgi:hypothetical protein
MVIGERLDGPGLQTAFLSLQAPAEAQPLLAAE